MIPLVAGLGTPELLIILAVVVLLFGAAKLPELARGSGRALRIFKAETKGLMDDDEDEPAKGSTDATASQKQLEVEAKQRELAARQAELDAEAEKLRRGETA
jgi:sec-independent protein translocase protein TatA